MFVFVIIFISVWDPELEPDPEPDPDPHVFGPPRHRPVERRAGPNILFVYVIIVISVGDLDPHIFGPPRSGSLVRCMDPDPDPSLFS